MITLKFGNLVASCKKIWQQIVFFDAELGRFPAKNKWILTRNLKKNKNSSISIQIFNSLLWLFSPEKIWFWIKNGQIPIELSKY